MKPYFLIVFVLFWLPLVLHGQQKGKRRDYKRVSTAEVSDTLTHYSQSDIFDFPNVNHQPSYHDGRKLRQLKALEEKGDEGAWYAALRAYVKNFGVLNFSHNTDMLWQLARLSQKHGPPGESVLLYKLVLKHHHGIDTRKIRSEFDTLTRNERDYYVPLKEYYELVEYRKEIDTLRPPQGVLVRMDDWVNSPQADYGPTIGNVDSVLLFTSKRNVTDSHVDKKVNEDLFFTIRNGDFWEPADAFNTINTSNNEGSACLSHDGKVLYFARCDSPDSYGSCDIFQAELKSDSTWGNVKNLGTAINGKAWDSHPSLSHGGDTLFFASDRLGGFGMTDIYYAVKNTNGDWGPAQNIGPIINTRRSEVSPFLHHRSNVLYFSSNGQPLNFGHFDIYKSYLVNNMWSEPRNIGPLVNGVASEYYFTIDSHSSRLYYARSEAEDEANLDLHSFPVPMEAKPDATAELKGSLVNANTRKPFRGIVSVIDVEHGVEVAPKYLRPDGSFNFDLINHRNYLLIIQGDEFFRIEEFFFMDGNAEMHRETEPIESKIAFETLEFEPGEAEILPSMHGDLARLGNFLIDHPHLRLVISGHTDSQGKEDLNLKLSQSRADAIMRYLVETFHVDSARIDAHGYGSSRPLVIEEQDHHRRLNRRVEFEITRLP